MKRPFQIVCVVVIVAALGSTASAVTIETVHVGDIGNTGELSGAGAGGYGPDSSCGAVNDEYNIGKYEVTTGQYRDFLNAVADTDTYGLYNTNMWSDAKGCKIERSGSPGSYTYSVAGDWANRPVNYVSWGDAARFANWLHNNQPIGGQVPGTTEDGSYFLNGAMSDTELLAVVRDTGNATWVIPTENEWYKAAYYDPASSSYYKYPTSSNSAPGRDMTEATNQGNNANSSGTPFPIDPPHYTTVAGEFDKSDSPHGTFDQGGNVFEWNETILYAAASSHRGIRGGAFDSMAFVFQPASQRMYADHPTDELDTFGFRVAEVPEPAALILMASGLPLLLRRKRKSR